MNRGSDLINKHGPGTEDLVALAPLSRAYSPTLRTVLGVDESVAASPVWDIAGRLVATGRVFLVRPLWHERWQRASGEISLVVGAPGRGVDDFDWDDRLPGDSWPDDEVVATAIVNLYWYRRVIILSADRAGDHHGLGSLLHKHVAPVLNRNVSHGLSLLLLLQRRKTNIEGYARRVYEYLSDAPFVPGFSAIEI